MADPVKKEAPVTLSYVAPPHDLDAEAAVLSTLLHEPKRRAEILALRPHHFYADANRRVFDTIAFLGDKADVVTVASRLRDEGRLAQIGGTPYLATLADATPSVSNVAAHADIVRELYRRRVLIAACQTTEAKLRSGEVTSAAVWEEFREEAARLNQESEDGG